MMKSASARFLRYLTLYMHRIEAVLVFTAIGYISDCPTIPDIPGGCPRPAPKLGQTRNLEVIVSTSL